jgi:TonB-dependent receptor
MPAGNATSWVVPDYQAALSVLSLNDPTAFGGAWRLGPEPSLGNNRGVDETDKGGFIQVDFATELFSIPFRGNFGVRYVKTEQTSRGFTSISGAPVAIEVEREYDDTLPSMNLVLEPYEGFLVRFAAAQTMTRPNLGDLTPGATINISGANRTVNAGNPNLDPFRAKAYDLSFEWYYAPEALISLALFKKDVDSFVQTLTTNTTFSGNPFGLPDSVAIAACGATPGCSPSAQWGFSAPVNTEGGTIKGYEISWQQPLSFLPGPLSNLGILANYTYVKSEIDYLNAAGVVVATNDIVGLSRNAYNVTVYYEDDKWSGRVSAAYRDRYLTRVPGQEAGTTYDGTNETFNVDASLTYSFNDNLKFSIEGVNLTDEFSDQFVDQTDRVQFYHHTGREFLIGVRYTY